MVGPQFRTCDDPPQDCANQAGNQSDYQIGGVHTLSLRRLGLRLLVMRGSSRTGLPRVGGYSSRSPSGESSLSQFSHRGQTAVPRNGFASVPPVGHARNLLGCDVCRYWESDTWPSSSFRSELRCQNSMNRRSARDPGQHSIHAPGDGATRPWHPHTLVRDLETAPPSGPASAQRACGRRPPRRWRAARRGRVLPAPRSATLPLHSS